MMDYYDEKEPRLTRGEYWILEAVVTFQFSLSLLVNEEIEMHLNKESHGLDRKPLVEILERLFAAGLIEAHKESDLDNTYSLNSDQIDIALNVNSKIENYNNGVYYGLTAKGGRVWEIFAKPDWNNFIDESSTTSDDYDETGIWESEIICAVREKVEDYFNTPDTEEEIILETVIWDEIKPWQATYWKQLPIGYRVHYKYKAKDYTNYDWVRNKSEKNQFYNRIFYRWG